MSSGEQLSVRDRSLARLSLDDADWRRFVDGHPDTTPFHQPEWAQLLAECYGFDGFVLAERDDAGAIVAGLPLLAPVRLPGRAHRLVSLPFTDLVRPLVDGPREAAFARALDATGHRLGFDRIELRSALEGATPLGDAAVVHTLPLAPDAESAFARLRKSKRREVRTAQQSGLVVRRAETERDLTETYFLLHLRTRHRLGVPSQPLRFFRLLWKRVLEPGHGFALFAEDRGQAVAGAVFLTRPPLVVSKYSATDTKHRGGEPTDLVFWHAICECGAQGFAALELGRVDLHAAGLRQYKSRWGAEERPLVYSVLGEGSTSGRRSGLAGRGMRPTTLAGRAIRRSPMWVTRLSGELLYRYAA